MPKEASRTPREPRRSQRGGPGKPGEAPERAPAASREGAGEAGPVKSPKRPLLGEGLQAGPSEALRGKGPKGEGLESRMEPRCSRMPKRGQQAQRRPSGGGQGFSSKHVEDSSLALAGSL